MIEFCSGKKCSYHCRSAIFENLCFVQKQSMLRLIVQCYQWRAADGMLVGYRWAPGTPSGDTFRPGVGGRWDAGGMPMGGEKFLQPPCHAFKALRRRRHPAHPLLSEPFLHFTKYNLPMEGVGSDVEYPRRARGSSTNNAFRCRFARCNASYQRKEHLNRHEKSKHTKQQSLICSSCGREFQRRYNTGTLTSYTHAFTVTSNARPLN